LLVSGGTTTHKPAVAAASAPGDGSMETLNRGNSGAFTARLNSKGEVFTFKGEGSLSAPLKQQPLTVDVMQASESTNAFVVRGPRLLIGRTFNLSESAKIETTTKAFSDQPTNLRERRLFNDQLQRVGGVSQGAPAPRCP